MKAIIALIASTAVTVGCATATIGADFNAANLPQMQPGKTTLAEATALLGRAATSTQTGQSGALGHTWSYTRASAAVGTVDTKTKSVTLVFNPNGTFQRVWRMDGIELGAEDRMRLFAAPQAAR